MALKEIGLSQNETWSLRKKSASALKTRGGRFDTWPWNGSFTQRMDVLFFRSKGNRRKIQRVLGLLVREAQDSSLSGRQRFKVKSRIDPESVFREVKGIRPVSILRLPFGTYLRRRANTPKTAQKKCWLYTVTSKNEWIFKSLHNRYWVYQLRRLII